MSKKINIAIDGYSSCGKSTIAKAIAKKYSFRYIDTGAMYRAITLYCLNEGILYNNELDYNRLRIDLEQVSVDFRFNLSKGESETFLNGKNVEFIIRGFDVSENVSLISQVKEVREKLVVLQKAIGSAKNVVMDGRDIGTKVFPDADLKFFITADLYTRAERRFSEHLDKSITFEQVLENLEKRDEDDKNRLYNPLRMADDAILIDNTSISIDMQNEMIFEIIDKEIN